ncbi:Glu/Leu/Phe/Val dehydrogenase dimerization domain-containing protein [Streptomyces sp. NPDC004327]|uniref:Glu/Leu/Phe/Val dehydrogenase dimerization domain-containing protein n=1 Tax=unclassified Streptomyces TaxID=2593676 RepID=UPI003677D038
MSEILEYVDPVEGFTGWLVYDRTSARMAAGGCRMQPGLTARTLSSLAARMTLKQRVLGISVDGAKCGVDYDPAAPGAPAAMERFLAFLREQLMTRFSMGCDMGTRFDELDAAARRLGIPSIKYAIKSAQGLSDDEFFARFRLLDAPAGALTLGERRAGHAVGHAALAAARAAGLTGRISVSLQGFGNLGRAAAYTLAEEGAAFGAVADQFACVAGPDDTGLDMKTMLAARNGSRVTDTAPDAAALPADAVFTRPCDVLVLAAAENAMTPEQAERLPASVVVVGANNGLSEPVERALHARGVLVVPDFIGGIGGSASMEALFGPERIATPQYTLDLIAAMMHDLTGRLISTSRLENTLVREVAERQAMQETAADAVGGTRAYGNSPLLARALSVV